MTSTFGYIKSYSCKLSLIGLIACCNASVVYSQSNITKSIQKNKTIVEVSHFPRNASVLILDDNFHLLSVATTDKNGNATIEIKARIKKVLFARTIHGDFEASTNTQPAVNKNQIATNRISRNVKA